MFDILAHKTYRLLFAAQIVSLIGTGLATVALGLLAYEIAGEKAGLVLGTALAIKMIAYVLVSPIASAFINILPRRYALIILNIIRALMALALPFVDQIWQIYLLIFLLQSASAAFTPAFQAIIPDILPEEKDYTKALSLSRLAYDMESLLSPVLAAALLSVISFHYLFIGTMIGFLIAAAFILSVTIPKQQQKEKEIGFYKRLTQGINSYFATPRLRALFALNLTVASAGALVIVNTVVFVRTIFQLSETEVAIALASFGAGSMASALFLPKLLETVSDRTIMLSGGIMLVLTLALISLISSLGGMSWAVFLCLWCILGLGYSSVMTPSGRLLKRSSHPENRAALFAAQFALSHACWLLTYPLSGWLGLQYGIMGTTLILSGVAALGVVLAFYLWPSQDNEILIHSHDNLPPDHPHLKDAIKTDHGLEHKHAYVIDEYHQHWPLKH